MERESKKDSMRELLEPSMESRLELVKKREMPLVKRTVKVMEWKTV